MEKTMEPTQGQHVELLQLLGLPPVLAETFADLIDWHETEELVARGWAMELALGCALMSAGGVTVSVIDSVRYGPKAIEGSNLRWET
jgi:hypothetical protein